MLSAAKSLRSTGVSAKSSTAEPGCEALRWAERKAAQGVIDIGDVDPGMRRGNRVRTPPQTLRVQRPFTLGPDLGAQLTRKRETTLAHWQDVERLVPRGPA